jgi:hypothetical protein
VGLTNDNPGTTNGNANNKVDTPSRGPAHRPNDPTPMNDDPQARQQQQ